MNFMFKALISVFLVFNLMLISAKEEKKASKIGKKITDYNDADLEKLLDQWNENDDDYDDEDEDDYDPRKKPPPKVDMQKIVAAGGDKEQILAASKKGQPMMIFANVAGQPTRKQTESITGIWQTSLKNAQIQVQRYVIADNRVLFQIEDGSKAIEIKNYLITLDDCESVSVDNMEFPGKGKAKQEL